MKQLHIVRAAEAALESAGRHLAAVRERARYMPDAAAQELRSAIASVRRAEEELEIQRSLLEPGAAQAEERRLEAHAGAVAVVAADLRRIGAEAAAEVEAICAAVGKVKARVTALQAKIATSQARAQSFAIETALLAGRESGDAVYLGATLTAVGDALAGAALDLAREVGARPTDLGPFGRTAIPNAADAVRVAAARDAGIAEQARRIHEPSKEAEHG